MKTIDELKSVPNLMIKHTSVDGGMGEMWKAGRPFASVIWSFGGGWEHVSIAPYNRKYTPTWDEMCILKNSFFRDDEAAVQYHPTKSEYVNNVPNCLHLWRPIESELPTPPSIMVGVRGKQSEAEIKKEIESVLKKS